MNAGAELKRVATQSISSGSATAISWDTEVVDNLQFYDGGAPTRATAQIAGWYAATAHVGFASQSGGYRIIQFRANGADVFGRMFRPTDQFTDPSIVTQVVCFLDAGEYLECQAEQNSGSSVNITAELQISAVDVQAGVGESAGVATVNGIAGFIGSAAGVATVEGFPGGSGSGSAAGVATVTGVASTGIASPGSSAGVATVTGWSRTVTTYIVIDRMRDRITVTK